MISRKTYEAIETIKRMDLTVAVPQKFAPTSLNDYCATTTDVSHQTIHVPSVISALEREISEAYRQVDDVKRATAMLLDIKREHGEAK